MLLAGPRGTDKHAAFSVLQVIKSLLSRFFPSKTGFSRFLLFFVKTKEGGETEVSFQITGFDRLKLGFPRERASRMVHPTCFLVRLGWKKIIFFCFSGTQKSVSSFRVFVAEKSFMAGGL